MGRILNYTSCMAIIACLLWSSAFAGIKIGLQYTTPLHFAGVRFFLAGLLVLPFCGSLATFFKQMRKSYRIVSFVAFFQTAFLYSFFYLGLELLPGAVAAIIIGTQPLTIAMVAHCVSRTERLTLRKIVSICFGVLGVTIIALDRGEFNISGGMELLGIAFLLLSNLSAAIGNLMVARKTADIPPLLLNCGQLILGGLLLMVLSLLLEQTVDEPYPLEYYSSLAWLSFLSAAALSIWFNLLKKEGVQVSDLNIWKFLIPLSGACLSWIFIEGESPEPATIAGMFLIALALMLLNIQKIRPL